MSKHLVRISDELYRKLEERARAARRSVTAQVAVELEKEDG